MVFESAHKFEMFSNWHNHSWLIYHIYTLALYLKLECVNQVLPKLEIRKIMTLVVYMSMHDSITPKWIFSGTSCKLKNYKA
jgi:hypothetical protein